MHHVFISHATEDDAVVAAIREALEGLRISARVDSRELVAGDQLDPRIGRAIEAQLPE